jgi:Ca-activated chloride channel family protein
MNIFYLLIAITAVIFFILAFGKKEKILALLRLNYQIRFRLLRSLFLCVSLSLMVFSILGPQVLSGYTEVSKTGLDIYFLIDTSKSMLVTDIKPDRMTIAKKIVGNLLNSFEGDRVGFIPFASGAYIQMPLTDDYQLARMFLDVMDTDMISGGGTNLAAALKLAGESFKRASNADRVIIILSDGEENDGISYNILQSMNDERIKIYTVGIGTEKGGLVPVYNAAGDAVTDYMIDNSGNPVTSRLVPENLQKLARDGNGSYFQATLQGTETLSLLEELSTLKRDVSASEQVARFEPLYQYFLGTGILLFIVAWLLPERRFHA